MTVTRVAYTDLILSFTLGTTTKPTATEAGSIITKLYRDAYKTLGITYAASDTWSDKFGYAVFETIQDAAQRIVQGIHDYLNPRGENQAKYPAMKLTQEEKDQLCLACGYTLRFASREDADLIETGDNVD